MRRLSNILQLGIKELRSLYRDSALLLLIVYAFTLGIYSSATGVPEAPHRATNGIIDEDRSQASTRIVNAFQLPYFTPPQAIDLAEMDSGMDAARYTFTLNIPPDFQQDLLAGRQPSIQLNVDATQVSQAFTGAGHIQQIIHAEVTEFLSRYRQVEAYPVPAVIHTAFNPNLLRAWFGAVNEVINQITLLSIILTGAALIREREHGTIEHLLVMPVTPFEIMSAKVWSMGLVVLLASDVPGRALGATADGERTALFGITGVREVLFAMAATGALADEALQLIALSGEDLADVNPLLAPVPRIDPRRAEISELAVRELVRLLQVDGAGPRTTLVEPRWLTS